MLKTGECLRGGYFTYHKALRNSVPRSHTWAGMAAPWLRFVAPAVPLSSGCWHTTDSSLAEPRPTDIRYFCISCITDTAFPELPESPAPCQTRCCAALSPSVTKVCRKQQICPPQAHSSPAQVLKRDLLVHGMETATSQLTWAPHYSSIAKLKG